MPFGRRQQKESRRLKSSLGEAPARFESCVRCCLEPFLSLACAGSLSLAIRRSLSIATLKNDRLYPSIIPYHYPRRSLSFARAALILVSRDSNDCFCWQRKDLS